MIQYQKQEDIGLKWCPDCRELKVIKMIYANRIDEDGKMVEVLECMNCGRKCGRTN